MATRSGSFASSLLQMEVGETKSFPLSKLNCVRSGASSYGLQWERKYTTAIRKEEHCVIVTREA